MTAAAYGAALLADCGIEADVRAASTHPAILWRASGCEAVTGHDAESPLMCPAPVAAAAEGALAALRALAPHGDFDGLSGAALLGQRARLLNLARRAPASAGGATRLLASGNRMLAVTLARPDDWACVAAWIGADPESGWDGVAAAISALNAEEVLARGRELGLAVAFADRIPAPAAWARIERAGEARLAHDTPVVLDFSALWAGPLCGALLQRAGARVIKVESVSRPDGARRGHGGFYDFLNGGKESVAIDFRAADGLAALRRLLGRADIVIDSARPRAWQHLGISPRDMIASRPGLTWISIAAHADDPAGTGYGDDAAAAAGFSQLLHTAHRQWAFCGDALADPLTGLHAAAAGCAAWRQGGGCFVTLALSAVARYCLGDASVAGAAGRARAWARVADRAAPDLLPLPAPRSAARPFGADTRAVLAC